MCKRNEIQHTVESFKLVFKVFSHFYANMDAKQQGFDELKA